jgi:putative phosphoesterase
VRKGTKAARGPAPVHAHETIALPAGGLRLVVVADTHGRPHPALDQRIVEAAPGHILHAGDIGDLHVLADLRKHAPVTAVRGNIDAPTPDLPDIVTIDLCSEGGTLLKLLLVHIAVSGVKIRADVARLARAEGATIVVCGHSHVPFAAHDRDLTVFNPGSVGPRRFQLPVVLGVIDVQEDGVSVRHISCETGLPWTGQ